MSNKKWSTHLFPARRSSQVKTREFLDGAKYPTATNRRQPASALGHHEDQHLPAPRHLPNHTPLHQIETFGQELQGQTLPIKDYYKSLQQKYQINTAPKLADGGNSRQSLTDRAASSHQLSARLAKDDLSSLTFEDKKSIANKLGSLMARKRIQEEKYEILYEIR